MNQNQKYMQMAIKQARKAEKEGEVPVGVVIVQGDVVISKAYNRKEKEGVATKHAEIIAIEKASKKKGDWRLDDCVMYTTLEPCLMCKGAIAEARIKKVIYGAKDAQNKKQNIDIDICQIEEKKIIKESAEILKKFFNNVRK